MIWKIFRFFIKLTSFLFGIMFFSYGLLSLYTMFVTSSFFIVDILISILHLISGIVLIIFSFQWKGKIK